MTLFEPLFSPRRIALIGASADPAKNTSRPQRLLTQHGFVGDILPINPGRSEVLGLPAYASLGQVPGYIDHAFITVATHQVEAALAQCIAKAVPVVTIYSDGFAESGPEGLALEKRLIEQAKAGGVRVLGPNCIGLVNVHAGVSLTVNSVLEQVALRQGDISVISQSGTMIGSLLSRGLDRGLGFAKLVSVGNEADIGVGELVELLVDDAHTSIVLLFLETLRDAPRLAKAARRAFAAGKAVVAYKLGRSSLGEALAQSHTGALAGSDAAMDAFFAQHGILRVEQFETLFELAPLIRARRPRYVASPTVAVLTTTGGGAASVVDRLGVLGLSTFEPDRAFIDEMALQGIPIKSAPIVDLTMAGTSANYRAVLKALLALPSCDAVLAVVGSSALSSPRTAVGNMLEFSDSDKPLAVYLSPHAPHAMSLLAEHGLAGFRTPEACADALATLLRWRGPLEQGEPLVMPLPKILAQGGVNLNEAQALDFFDSLGIPTVTRQITKGPDFTHGLGYPLVAKVVSADILHKTEQGGVVLGIQDELMLKREAEAMLARVHASLPQAHIEGLMLQNQVSGLAEAIIGYRHDALVGPIVMVGMGGRLAEVYRDTSVHCAPVSLAQAEQMISQVKGFALLRGFRGLPKGDLPGLARALVALSQLALIEGQPVDQAEINPLLVQETGVVALDAVLMKRGLRTAV